MAREARLWEWLRDGLRGTPGLHIRRVENMVSEGDPDVDGCWNGIYFEAELKGCNRPTKGGLLDFEVRQSQVIWHRRRWRCGGNLWVYVRVGKGAETCRYLVPGCHTARLKEGVTEQQLAELAVLPPSHKPNEALKRMAQIVDR